ncbi:beta family protein [Rhizobium sp. Rhizsp82]|uniref:beta family protein n=1 Tax=Rhizobium sp. Rhizsp82 TaxID=3243057 RepID=UPI0039B69BBA
MEFMGYRYIPILGVRPAEMKALEELPIQTKDEMLPYIVLQPWLSAKELASTVARINAAVGERSILADIAPEGVISGKRRAVHDAFDLLRVSDNGYANYLAFVAENENFIPSVQLADLTQLNPQIAGLAALDRGVAVRLHEPMLPYAGDIAARFAGQIPGDKIHFILDFEKQNKEILIKALAATQAITAIRAHLPDCSVSVSASTFPDSFVGLDYQDIFERQFFNAVNEAISAENIVYCDRGSARAEALGGGGGQPAPRIDLANLNRWNFFRVDDEDDKLDGFRQAATNAVASPSWDDIGIWGTEYIKRTSDDSESDIIDSAAKCTAARINIHLHVQATHGLEDDGADVGWSD